MELIDINEAEKIKLNQLLNNNLKTIKQFTDTQFDKKYTAYLIETCSGLQAVLKKISLNEYVINNILKENINNSIMPISYELIQSDNDYWLLSEYIKGNDLSVLDSFYIDNLSQSLAEISSTFFFNNHLLKNLNPTFNDQLQNKYSLLNKLEKGTNIYNAYSIYIKRFTNIPLTLVHDDLLPINVLVNKKQLKIIDWEHGRLGSYVTDITRFCCFYYSDKAIFDRGFGFFGGENLIAKIKEDFYFYLDNELKEIVSFKQFQIDYELESLNQNILNLAYLEKINSNNLSSEWDKFFYKNLQQISARIISKST